VFFLYTIFWIAFVVILQASITSTFDYLLSGGSRVIAEWVTLAAVFVVAVFFTYIYLRFDSPLAEYVEEKKRKTISQIVEHAQSTKEEVAQFVVTKGMYRALGSALGPAHDEEKPRAHATPKGQDKPDKPEKPKKKPAKVLWW
jgi:Na+/H+ antiporter NhaB